MALGTGGCASFVEIPVETPLQSKLDVSAFRRVMIAGFITEPGAQADVDIATETARLLQNQLRSGTRMQVLEPDRPPLNEALDRVLSKMGEGGRLNKHLRAASSSRFWRPLEMT